MVFSHVATVLLLVLCNFCLVRVVYTVSLGSASFCWLWGIF
jgi:hypothetical protein